MVNIQRYETLADCYPNDESQFLMDEDFDWETEDEAEFRAGMADAYQAHEEEPTHCELCSRKLTEGDCIPCQVSFTVPF